MKKRLLIILSVSIACVLVLAAIICGLVYKERSEKFCKDGNYQAVFLSSGQVYFGKIAKDRENWIVLKDVYYLQNQKSSVDTNSDQNSLQLVKMGTELHGPENEMQINRSQVSFIENLRQDSKVVKAISDLSK